MASSRDRHIVPELISHPPIPISPLSVLASRRKECPPTLAWQLTSTSVFRSNLIGILGDFILVKSFRDQIGLRGSKALVARARKVVWCTNGVSKTGHD
ncbi:uncharacterized protein ANIA_11440 [Aspergillus nidulans FGSC A4]|uniref:Uncharacterized protein n=1 Tax=Emericella nidulans (strain FGSC A4 / ATCC 38163 / CBS 112.46 / NRRL 194 / M139) TaxID=227321 RepID=C8V8B7_EMENI|nr:hypothetical protein [Aspergillus nidulans FGSC A4]CBF77353.1 TPA: hypothetical protein ANIA_11440 [Aspergillus nidulans FGSC A4]